MTEKFSPQEVVDLAECMLAKHSVEPAQGPGRLSVDQTAMVAYGRDRLEVDRLLGSLPGQQGFRFVYGAAEGPIRNDVEPPFQRTTVLWHMDGTGPSVRVSTLTDNHGNAEAVIAHFMRAAA